MMKLLIGCAWLVERHRRGDVPGRRLLPDHQVKTTVTAAFLFGALAVSAAAVRGAEELSLDFGWERTVGGETRAVDLPDDFHINSPWVEPAGGNRAFKPETNGVYRQTFVADAGWKGRRVFLDFAGVQCFCDVVLNGEKVASWEYGSLGFEVDVTEKLRFGAPNAVEVRCGTGDRHGSRWYAGCGITRGAKIVVRNAVAFRRHGLAVTTPKATVEAAEVRLVADVTGWMARTNGSLAVIARLLDPDGRSVGESRSAIGFSRNCLAEVELPPVTVARPRLWDLDAPHLYRVEARLLCDGVEVDSLSRRFGIRSVAFGPDFGFRLNGRKVFFQGMANHQHLGALGEASFPRAWRRQVKLMKEFGYNCLRCAHNPYPEDLLDVCDEEGLLVVDELVDKWRGCWAGRVPFMADASRYVAEWVGRDRNHPSVVLWSLGNETQQHPDFLPFDDGNYGRTEYAVLDALVKRWDRSRPTTVAMFPSRAQNRMRVDADFWNDPVPPELSTVTEVASYNYVPGDYANYRRHFPHLAVFQSEAAVNALTRAYYLMDRETSVGLCYWGAIEYWGESDGWPKKGWNYSFFRRTLDPHPQAWLVRSAFRSVDEEPIVRIGVETGAPVRKHWNDVDVGTLRLAESWQEGRPTRRVFVFTNADAAELLLNGRSLGRRTNERQDPERRNILEWPDVAWSAGRLEAVAFQAGREVARTRIETTGQATDIAVRCEGPDDWRADGKDLQYVCVEAVDAAGRRVRDAVGRVTFSVAGAATLRAVDDGDASTARRFDGPAADLHVGQALGILRSKRPAGDVTVTVDAGPLGKKTLNLKTK